MPRRSTEKASLKYLVPLIGHVKKYAPLLITAICLAVFGTICTIIGPHYLSKITDLIEEGLKGASIDLNAVSKIGIFLIAAFIISGICMFFQGFIMTIVTQKTTYGLREGVIQKINHLPLKYFDSRQIGDILSLVSSDVDMIGQTMSQSIGNLFQYGTQFIMVMFIMLFTNWILTLVSIGAVIIGFFLLLLITSHSQKYFSKVQEFRGQLNGHNEEIFNGQQIVKVYNGEEKEKRIFDSINKNLYDNNWRSMFFGSMLMPIMGFVGNLGYVAVCVVGAIMALNGSISFGVIVSFMLYIRFFTSPLQQFGSIFTQLQSTAAASKRVFEFFEEDELEDESGKSLQISKENIVGNIKFEHVHFGYEKDVPIINDFSMEAKAGQKIAIVGPTGAGKTTLVNLLMRFYEIDSGKITIDGISTKDMSREELHGLFGMVLQDTWLFEGTFLENIKYNLSVSDEAAFKSAKIAGIDHFIKTTPKGYDTVITEDANVSAGQKQLLTIARAMTENAPFLILDEATSSVDTRTEEVIQEAMDALMKGRTSFVIAHRLSTIKNADLILVMNHGDIIEQGTHDELMKQGGFYSELYNSQFESLAE